MELRDYVAAARRNAVLLIALVLLGIVGGAVFTRVQAPVYQATAQDYVSVQAGTTASDLSSGAYYAQGVVAGYGKVAGTDFVLTPVIKSLRLNTSATDLAKSVTVTSDPDTSILSITVKDRSPRQAVAVANAVASQLTTAVNALTPRASGGSRLVLLTRIQSAVTPTAPSSPVLLVDLGLGALAGLVLGLIVAIARESLDTRLREPAEAARIAGAALIGEVLTDKQAQVRPVVVVDRPRSLEAEAYQSLRTNLDFLGLAPGRNAIVITSSKPAEGKTLTTLNLAAALSSSQRVLLIDADLRRPRVARYLGLDGAVGLTDVLIGAVPLADAVQTWSNFRLNVLPAGRIPPNPADLLRSPEMIALLDDVASRYDVVLIDTPPLLAVSDAAVVTRHAAGALVVSAMRSTRRQQLAKAVEQLSGGHVFGVVATMVQRARRDSYGYEDRIRPEVTSGQPAPPPRRVKAGVSRFSVRTYTS